MERRAVRAPGVSFRKAQCGAPAWRARRYHRVYRTTASSSIAGWFVGRRASASREAAPTSKTFTTLDVRLDGYLLKRGSWRKNWKTRFFVLRRDAARLAYYDGPSNLKLLGEVLLVSGGAVAEVSEGGSCDARAGAAPFAIKCASRAEPLRLAAFRDRKSVV